MASTSTPMGGGRAASGSGLFTRQSSGLVRELGIPAATAISLASVAVVNTFINFNAGLTAFSQADMTLPLLLGAGVWLVAMFAYKYLLEAIPRAGGEYVYLSRIISPAIGAMAGISICIAFTFILALVMFQLVAFLVLGWLLVTHSHQDFMNALGQFSGHPNAYNDILAAAAKDNIPIGVSLSASLLVVPFMVLNYNGVLYSYYVGGELRRPSRTYIWASVLSIGVLVVVWVGIWLLMLNTVGLDFMQAQAKLGATDAPAYGAITSLQSSAGGLGYGLVRSCDPISKIVIGLAVPSIYLVVGPLINTPPEVFGAFRVSSVEPLVLVLRAGPVIYLIARQIRVHS